MQVSKKIVAIGGGEMRDLTTLAIDREIVRLTNKEHPRTLFIPTASGDADEYWQKFQAVYGEQLGCAADVLWLLKEKPTAKQIEDKVLAADLIYVGGGNTLRIEKYFRPTVWLRDWRILKRIVDFATALPPSNNLSSTTLIYPL